MDSRAVTNGILQTIDLIAGRKIANIPYDTTIRATISKILSDNEYKVKYFGNEFIAYSEDSNKRYKINDWVYVQIPQNNLSNKKFIQGLVEGATSYVAIDELKNTTLKVKPAILSSGIDQEVTLKSFDEEQKVDGFFDRNQFNINWLTTNCIGENNEVKYDFAALMVCAGYLGMNYAVTGIYIVREYIKQLIGYHASSSAAAAAIESYIQLWLVPNKANFNLIKEKFGKTSRFSEFEAWWNIYKHTYSRDEVMFILTNLGICDKIYEDGNLSNEKNTLNGYYKNLIKYNEDTKLYTMTKTLNLEQFSSKNLLSYMDAYTFGVQNSKYQHVKLSAEFCCGMEDNIDLVNYGLKIYYIQDDEKYESYFRKPEIEMFVLDTSSFVGDFEKLNFFAEQSILGYLYSEEISLKNLIAHPNNFVVKLFCNFRLRKGSITSESVFVSVRNLSLNFVKIVNLSTNEYFAQIDCTKGETMTQKIADSKEPFLDLNAEVYAKEINCLEDGAWKVEWAYYDPFKKFTSSNNVYVNSDFSNGWVAINSELNLDDRFILLDSNRKLKIQFLYENFQTYELKIKFIAKNSLNNQKASAEVTLYNKESANQEMKRAYLVYSKQDNKKILKAVLEDKSNDLKG